MKSYIIGALAAATVLVAPSCTTLTKMGLNPAEECYSESATVIRAGAVTFQEGTGFGKGKGKTISAIATSGYSQTVVIRTKSGKTFTHEESSSILGAKALHVGDTGVAEIGKISNKLWSFKAY